MKTISRLAITGIAAAAAAAGPAIAANASTITPADAGRGAAHAVFVQTDNLSGNQIVAYHRDASGRLSLAGAYPTGGLGGQLAGSVVDHLASQGSLAYDARHAVLLAVNAGSNTVSVFDVHGDRLNLRQVIASGGAFPVSIAVHGDTAYVLNALNGGSIQGFTLHGGRLVPVAAWHRALGLDPTATPQFTHTPGQVGFAADGSKLVVTTKAGGQSVEVFALAPNGAPAAAPTVTALPGAVPFAFVVDRSGRLVLAEAGTNTLATFTLTANGTLVSGSSLATGQAATCWVAADGDLLYASNAGSATLSGAKLARDGALTPLTVTPTDAGTVDAAASSDGRYLYAQTGGNGIVDEFAVGHDGSLTRIGAQTVPDATGAEGILAF